MDPRDTGYVTVELILQCLSYQNGALLELVNAALGGGNVPQVAHLKSFGNDYLSINMDHSFGWCGRLLTLLLKLLAIGDHKTDLTWGEVSRISDAVNFIYIYFQ
jgi:hypothetical protein